MGTEVDFSPTVPLTREFARAGAYAPFLPGAAAQSSAPYTSLTVPLGE
jgi:hypothetical protein